MLLQVVAAVSQFPSVQAAIDATVMTLQSGISIARIGWPSYANIPPLILPESLNINVVLQHNQSETFFNQEVSN